MAEIPDATLILVRHSLPTIDPYQPAESWPLSASGREDAQRLSVFLGDHLKHKPVKLFSSWEQKAIQTAQIIAIPFQQPVTIYPGLQEHLRRRVKFSSQDQFEADIANFYAHPEDCVFGEESANQVYERFAHAINQILDAYPGRSLILVTHGTVMSLWVARNYQLQPLSIWRQLKPLSLIQVELSNRSNVQIISDLAL